MVKRINIVILFISFFTVVACTQVESDLTIKDIPTKTYTVIFNANGGCGSMPNQTLTYDVTSNLIPNDFTRTDYTFCGWTTLSDGTTPDFADCQAVKNLTTGKSITLYALWTEEGKVTPVVFTPVQGKIDYADKVALSCLIDDVTIYYTTDGSAPTENSNKYTEPITVDTAVALKVFAVKNGMKSSVISTANYTIKTYTVTFEDETGKLQPEISGLKKNDTVKEEQFPVLAKTGYTFAGWYNDEIEFTKESLICENVILTAKWTPNTYSVIFDANGGKGSMVNQTLTYDVTSDLTANTFTKTDCTFYGWTTEANGNSPDFTNKQPVKNLTTGNIVKLYAVWGQNATAVNVADIITKLPVSEEPYTVKVTGEISDDTISAIRTAFRVNSNVKVILDLSATTGLTSIKESAFENCSNLIGIILGDSFEEIEDKAFSACCNLTNITFGNNLETIGNEAFAFCNNLISVVIGNNIETIGDYAFGSCNNLTSVVLGDSVEMIGEGVFAYNFNLTNITFDEDLLFIGAGAFTFCSSLTSIALTDNVKIIEQGAFSGCINLKDISFGDDLEVIEGSAFAGCTGLQSVVIGNKVKEIGYGVFEACSSLTSVIVGNTVELIGESSFEGCGNLTNITIGEKVKTISDRAFVGCSNLSFTVSDKNDFYSASDDKKILFSKDKTVLVAYPSAYGSVTIPTEVITIGASAFSRCTQLSSVTIPDSVISIGDYAFSYCTELSEVTMPDSVTLKYDVFRGCEKLTPRQSAVAVAAEEAIAEVVAAIEDEVLVQTQSEYVALTEEEIEELIRAGVIVRASSGDSVFAYPALK